MAITGGKGPIGCAGREVRFNTFSEVHERVDAGDTWERLSPSSSSSSWWGVEDTVEWSLVSASCFSCFCVLRCFSGDKGGNVKDAFNPRGRWWWWGGGEGCGWGRGGDGDPWSKVEAPVAEEEEWVGTKNDVELPTPSGACRLSRTTSRQR